MTAAIVAIGVLASCAQSNPGSTGGTADGPVGSIVTTFSKSYGGPLHDEASVVLSTEDGGFMLFGTADGIDFIEAQPAAPFGGDIWMQKLDGNGNIEHSRLLGEHSIGTERHWKRARPTSDGGVVLTGMHAVQQSVTRVREGQMLTQNVTVGLDLAVAKLDATGRVLWNVSHDSGGWPGYDYFAGNGPAAEASDTGLDIWPLDDGGYLVAGVSTANLEDRSAIGFPCEDEQLDELATNAGYPSCEDAVPPSQPGSRFMHAVSIVVMRLDANGALRWTRRLTDNAFDINGNERVSVDGLGLLIRATAGGAVVARAVSGGALVYRMGADGSARWRSAVGFDARYAAVNHAQSAAVGEPFPVALTQTVDPDGDGVALSMGVEVFKLDAQGELEWRTDLGRRGAQLINDIAQGCHFDTPQRCDIVAVGQSDESSSASPRYRGIGYFIDDRSGEVRTEGRDPTNAVRSLTRISTGSRNTLELLGSDQSGLLMRLQMQLPAQGADTAMQDLRSGTNRGTDEASSDNPLPELRPDGGLVALNPERGVLDSFDSRAMRTTTWRVADATAQSEELRAAVRIGPGRYVLAGERRGPEPGVLISRYDLDAQAADAGRLVWQLEWPTDLARVFAAAATSDGGAVMSLSLSRSEIPETVTRESFLLKIDAAGDVRWRLPLPEPASALQPMPDGGVAALSQRSTPSVTRVSADGQPLWRRTVEAIGDPRTVVTMASTAEGLVLAANVGSRIWLARLGISGDLLGARELVLPQTRGQIVLGPIQVRQADDGSYVLATSESGNLTTLDVSQAVVPYGQTNALVLKLDANLAPLWARIYGARFDEGVRDLALAENGTIAVAGFSDSLGDLREAWLLRLSADGSISEGCQALLGSIPVALIETGTTDMTVTPAEIVAPGSMAPIDEFASIDLPLQAPEDFITARQCVGEASGNNGPAVTQRLSIEQVGGRRGVVTSEPRGLSCGTGVDICAADFPRGSSVTLRADPNGFVAWRSECAAGSGGERLDCVVALDSDRTVRVEFADVPEQFTLSFVVEGPGAVLADGDIDCREGGPAPGATCSQTFVRGTRIDLTARPDDPYRSEPDPARFVGWGGDCATFGTTRSMTVTLDRSMSCVARFQPPNTHRVTMQVTGAGTVFGEVPSPARFECREDATALCDITLRSLADHIRLDAVPDFGYRFASWGGDCAAFGSTASIDLAVPDNRSCTARFEQTTTPIALNVEIHDPVGTSAVQSNDPGIHCTTAAGSDCGEIYPPGTRVILRSTRNGVPWAGVSWSGCDQVWDLTDCHVLMHDVPRYVRAVFSQ